MEHYYDEDARRNAVVLDNSVVVVGEYGACFLVVEQVYFDEWKRLITSSDEENQRQAQVLEWLVCKRKHAHIV